MPIHPQEYIWIKKWGAFLGSQAYFIADQQALAAKELAPLNAIYRGQDGRWQTTDDITSETTRHALGLSPLSEGSNMRRSI